MITQVADKRLDALQSLQDPKNSSGPAAPPQQAPKQKEFTYEDALKLSEEKKEKKKHKTWEKFFAFSEDMDRFIRTLSSIGSFWTPLWGLFGPVGGFLSLFGMMSGSITTAESAFSTQVAARNRNWSGTRDGLLGLTQGIAVLGASMPIGITTIPAAVAIGAGALRLYYMIKELVKDDEKKAPQAAQQNSGQPVQQATPEPTRQGTLQTAEKQ